MLATLPLVYPLRGYALLRSAAGAGVHPIFVDESSRFALGSKHEKAPDLVRWVLFCSFLLSVCRRQTKDVRFCESPSDTRASRREERGANQKKARIL